MEEQEQGRTLWGETEEERQKKIQVMRELKLKEMKKGSKARVRYSEM